MNELHAKAAFAGLCFGIWPLLLNRSGLAGNVSATVYTVFVLAIVAPFALPSLASMAGASWLHFAAIYAVFALAMAAGGAMLNSNSGTGIDWRFVAASAVIGSMGLVSFNSMLAKAPVKSVSIYFVIMVIVQTAVPAAYSVAMNGHLPASKALGFVLAAVSAVLLIL